MENKVETKVVVLLSGGIDSTTCLAMAVDNYGAERVVALSASYGQKHTKELLCASEIANYYKVRHYIQDLSAAFAFSNCSLLTGRENIVHKSYAEQLAEMGGQGTVSTYVPFRNGLFLAFAAAVATSLGAELIYYGAHADDAAGRAYPDCTPQFETAMNRAIYEGSGHQVKLRAPLLNLNKAQVVSTGISLNAPYHLTWSCYEGKEKQCGVCGTCIDRKVAFAANARLDPVPYEV
jgi:7-cyano-7-deazaguanine synthase